MSHSNRSVFLFFLFAGSFLALILNGCAPAPLSQYPPAGPSSPATQRPYTINGKTYYPIPSAEGYRERGKASWYGKKFHGRKTSNGETYNMYGMTAAHKTLPMNTVLLIRNMDNGRETVVRVNDRGPFVRGRIIDLSYTAANKINLVKHGVARVEIIAMGERSKPSKKGGKKSERFKHQDFNQGNFYIQVGSFLNKNNAERIARLFLKSGVRVIIQPYITSGYTYYRIQVYAGNMLKPARMFEQQLLQSGYPGAFLISR